jgi:hypothetical protein
VRVRCSFGGSRHQNFALPFGRSALFLRFSLEFSRENLELPFLSRFLMDQDVNIALKMRNRIADIKSTLPAPFRV